MIFLSFSMSHQLWASLRLEPPLDGLYNCIVYLMISTYLPSTKKMSEEKKKNQLPLHVCKTLQPQATINKLHTIFHTIIIFSLLTYRASVLLFHHHSFITTTHFLSWILISASEFLLSFLWFLGQAYRWRPITRTVFPERLPADEELPPIDIFICTADPTMEPTEEVMNTVLSAMSLDYPPEKLSVYLSDDAGSQITLFAIKEAFIFAKFWIPFCKKYEVETRCPKAYLSASGNDDFPLRGNEFLVDKENIKSKYKVFKERVERAVENGDPNIHSPKDHPSFIEVLSDDAVDDLDKAQNKMPLLVYVSREKGRSYHHHFKAGALNVLLRVSSIISNAPYILVLDCDMYSNDPSSARQAMCFHLDPEITSSLAFVQFRQDFHNMTKNDIYNGHLRYLFRILWYGIDGIQGPILSGTGFYIKREALCSIDKERDTDLLQSKQHFGNSNDLISSIRRNPKFSVNVANGDASNKLKEAQFLASCTYEENTTWGEQIGFMYHSVVEDYFTGFLLHCKGWTSVYYSTSKPSFLGSVTINLNDNLVQSTRWYSGLLQVGFSRFCPLIYGFSRMPILQNMAYSFFAFQALDSLPLLVFASIPQICLLSGMPLFPKVSNPWFFVFVSVQISSFCQKLAEVLISKGSLKSWMYDHRMAMMRSVTAYVFSCLDIVMKGFGIKEIEFMPTNKVVDEEQEERYKLDKFDFQTSTTFLLPLTSLAILNMAAFIVGVGRMIFHGGFDELCGQVVLSFLVLTISYPVIEGMLMRKDKGRIPTSVTLLSFSFIVVFFSVKEFVLGIS